MNGALLTHGQFQIKMNRNTESVTKRKQKYEVSRKKEREQLMKKINELQCQLDVLKTKPNKRENLIAHLKEIIKQQKSEILELKISRDRLHDQLWGAWNEL